MKTSQETYFLLTRLVPPCSSENESKLTKMEKCVMWGFYQNVQVYLTGLMLFNKRYIIACETVK